jgi:hypothetical protein
MPIPVWMPVIGPIISLINLLKPGAVNNYPEAAKALDGALSKLETHYGTISDTLNKLTYLPIDDSAKLNEAKAFLRDVTDGHLYRELQAARAHCGEIWMAYVTHLRGWFTRLVDTHLQLDLENLFVEIRDMDKGFVGSVESVANYAVSKAPELLSLIQKGDKLSLKEAMNMVESIEADVWQNKVALNSYLAQMRGAHASFLQQISSSSIHDERDLPKQGDS